MRHHVALTSTLTVFETFTPGQPLPPGIDVLDPILAQQFQHELRAGAVEHAVDLRQAVPRERAMELAFVHAGGLLVAGTDPTGGGGVIPGFSDQRQVELLVASGFTPLEAIKICTLERRHVPRPRGSRGLARRGQAGRPRRHRRQPGRRHRDIRKVELVFRQGVGYDPQKLIASVKGRVGLY